MSIYKQDTQCCGTESTTKPVRKTGKHAHVTLSARQRAVLTCIWTLDKEEISYLDRYFFLKRSLKELMEDHSDDGEGIVAGHFADYITNGGIRYRVVYNCCNWEDLESAKELHASFRYQKVSNFAVVIIKQAGTGVDQSWR